MDETRAHITPPYLSYVTFRNTIKTLALEGKLPRQIDRTVLPTMSGAAQKQFLASLRFFGLIDEHGTPHENLNKLARGTDAEWKDFIGQLLKERYPNEVEQLEDASPKTIRDSFVSSFEGIGASLVEPAIRFLVTAAKDCGLPVSAHLGKRKIRAASAPRGKPRKIIRQAVINDADDEAQADSEESVGLAFLSKLPDFDVSWSEAQQKAWFSAYETLLKFHSSAGKGDG